MKIEMFFFLAQRSTIICTTVYVTYIYIYITMRRVLIYILTIRDKDRKGER